jgi:F0F1-type ATP synthase assembly protein I
MTSKTTKLAKTASPASQDKTQSAPSPKNTALTIFAGAVLDLTWQMAIVVLVPVIGGYELDKRLGTSPLFIIIGFILALVGTYVIMKRMLTIYSQRTLSQPRGRK